MKRSTFVFLLRWLSDRNINDLENGAERLEHEGKETSFLFGPSGRFGGFVSSEPGTLLRAGYLRLADWHRIDGCSGGGSCN